MWLVGIGAVIASIVGLDWLRSGRLKKKLAAGEKVNLGGNPNFRTGNNRANQDIVGQQARGNGNTMNGLGGM